MFFCKNTYVFSKRILKTIFSFHKHMPYRNKKKDATFRKPCSVFHLSLIYVLPCDKTLSSYPSAVPSRHFAMTNNHCMPIYLDFQLIRFTRKPPSLTAAAGSYPAFSPLPLKTVHILKRHKLFSRRLFSVALSVKD